GSWGICRSPVSHCIGRDGGTGAVVMVLTDGDIDLWGISGFRTGSYDHALVWNLSKFDAFFCGRML
ncbi:hypothetical protein Tco_1259809, partial [Tanacetum coccineum]